MNLLLHPQKLCVCRFQGMPQLCFESAAFYSVTKTAEEWSVVCDEAAAPKAEKKETGFRALQIAGELDFSLIGILSRISSLLAEHNVSIFVLSTYNTDYILVKESQLPAVLKVLKENGYQIKEK